MQELPTILLRLSHDIINIIKGFKDVKKIRKMRRLYVRNKITHFEYKNGNASLKAKPIYFEKEEWDWIDRIRKIEAEVKKLSLYSKAYEVISEIYGVNKVQAESWISRFIQNVAGKALDEYAREKSLLNSVILFLNDLEGNPIIWDISSELKGVWIKDEEVKIHKGLKIRSPQPKDFEFERPFDIFPFRARARNAVRFQWEWSDFDDFMEKYGPYTNLEA